MTPLVAVNTTIANNGNYSHTDGSAFDVLYRELEKGIQSMKKGEVCTVEEAWEEIDKI